jgi:hypothetical protein
MCEHIDRTIDLTVCQGARMNRTGTSQPLPGWDGADGNNAYLDKTLRHIPVETVLDDRVSGRTILRLGARAVVISWLVTLVLLVVGVPLAAVSGSSSDSYGYGSSAAPLDSVLTYVMFIWVLGLVIFLVILFFGKLTEPIAEWRVLLHARADVESAYAQIHNVVRERGYPLQLVASPRGNGPARQLVLSQDDCSAHISVFTYGNGLYLGWQMWRTRSKLRLIVQFLSDAAGGKGNLQWAMARTAQLRAMREAVHAACREGLVVAVEGRPVQLAAGFPGGGIPMAAPAGLPVTGSFPVQEPPRPSAPPLGPVPAAPPAAPSAPPVVPPDPWAGGRTGQR